MGRWQVEILMGKIDAKLNSDYLSFILNCDPGDVFFYLTVAQRALLLWIFHQLTVF